MAAIFRVKLFNLVEEEITFEDFIKYPLTVFRLVLFDFHPEIIGQTSKIKYLHCIKKCSEIFIIFFLHLIILQLIIYGIVHSDNFATSAAAIGNAISGTLVVFKTISTLFRKDELWTIFMELKEIFVSRNDGRTKYKVKNYLDGYLSIVKAFSFISLVICLTTWFTPLVTYIIFNSMNPTLNYWFPFDIFHSHTFPIALFWADYACYLFAMLQVASDLLLYALITVVAMEFDFLKLDFSNLGLESKQVRNAKVTSLIDRHNKLLDLTDKLQQFYGPLFFLGFFLSSVIICLILFQLSTVESNSSENAFQIPFLFIMGGQTLLYCIFGQKLVNSSVGVADGIYDMEWMELDDNDFKKKIILIIIRAHRPKKITAMKFADVSLESFTSVRIFCLIII